MCFIRLISSAEQYGLPENCVAITYCSVATGMNMDLLRADQKALSLQRRLGVEGSLPDQMRNEAVHCAAARLQSNVCWVW